MVTLPMAIPVTVLQLYYALYAVRSASLATAGLLFITVFSEGSVV